MACSESEIDLHNQFLFVWDDIACHKNTSRIIWLQDVCYCICHDVTMASYHGNHAGGEGDSNVPGVSIFFWSAERRCGLSGIDLFH